MCASSADPATIIEIDIAKIETGTEQVHLQHNIWELEEGEEFVGLAVVTVTAKKQRKIKSVNMCK